MTTNLNTVKRIVILKIIRKLGMSYLRKRNAKRRNRHGCRIVTSTSETLCLQPFVQKVISKKINVSFTKIKKIVMEKSRSIAKIVGPTLIVMVLSELKLWNPTLYDTQITPLVYLSGILFFVSGITIVCSHNIWNWSWQAILTIIAWCGILLGLIRMFFPQMYNAQAKNDTFLLMLELLLILLGVFLTFKAYLPVKNKPNSH